MEAVRLIGELVSLSKFHLGKDYPTIFVAFLERFSDDSIQVRIAAVESVKSCIILNPSGDEESVILSKSITCNCLLLILNFATFYC
jgi:sister chromatid cohesion protein PDS5